MENKDTPQPEQPRGTKGSRTEAGFLILGLVVLGLAMSLMGEGRPRCGCPSLERGTASPATSLEGPKQAAWPDLSDREFGFAELGE